MKFILFSYIIAALLMFPASKFYKRFGFKFWPWDDLVFVFIILAANWWLRKA